MVLETPEERILFLKAGYMGKQIERMYVNENGYTINRDMVLREL